MSGPALGRRQLPALAAIRRTRPATVVIAAVLVTAVAGVWWISAPFLASAQTRGTAVAIHQVKGATWRPDLGQPLFIAVMGSDARTGPPDSAGGCDAIHIVAINPQAKAGTILNFPRDSYLPAPGGGGRKITDTCRTAGFETAIQILKSETRLNVQYYVKTQFSNFRALIDELGGIDVDVPYAMNDTFSGANFPKATVHMGGEQALSFTRNRHDTPNGDFSRTENQGLLLLAALAKFRSEGADPHRILDYLKAARRHVKITIPLTDLVKMGLLATEIDSAAIRNQTIPGSTDNINGASVVILSPGDIYQRVRDDGLL